MKQLFGPDIDIDYCDVFTMKNEHSYAAFIGVLSNIYMKAHASSVFRTQPYVAALVINSQMLEPYKNQPESSLVRLKAIVSRMKKIDDGIKLGIFLNDEGMFSDNAKIGLKHVVSQCWPINNTFNTKDFITINLPPSQLRNNENVVRYFEYSDIQKSIEDYEIQLVNYNTPISQIFDYFEKSKIHICYQGGTAWLSVAMNIPTIIVHPIRTASEFHLKFKLFGQDLGNINILNDYDQIDHVRIHPSEHHTYIEDLEETLEKVMK